MKKGTVTKTILISFVGTNDAGKLRGTLDGAVLTIFKKRRFDEVHLLWNYSEAKNLSFEDIARYVKNEIIQRGFSDTVLLHRFNCDDVTDHNEIYPKLLGFCQSLPLQEKNKFTAAIASGTPAMQVCWILMAESGDFPLELIRSNEARFGKAPVTPVRLGTGLPRIIRLQQENDFLKQEKLQLIPDLHMRISRGLFTIAGVDILFSPVEFSYYRYFAERAKNGLEFERFSGISAPVGFLRSIVKFHKESFPESELFRKELEMILKSGRDLDIGTVRANISKTNRKLRVALSNPSFLKFFQIAVMGKRHATLYGISAPPEKIHIEK